MHWLGPRLAIVALPALVLPLAASCTQNSSAQFHAYQPTDKPAEDKSAAPQRQQSVQAPVATIVAAPTSGPAAGSPATNSSSKVLASAPAISIPASEQPAMAAKGSPSATSSTSRRVQLLIPNKTFRPEGDAAALRVSYDDIDLLKVLNMDPVPPDAATYMPGWLKALDGRRIRIRGFMYPTFQQTGVHAFGLARDNQICCFGRNPRIYDVFDVVLHEGATTNYIPNRPFDVVGVFHIRPEAEDGKLYRLYEMDDATVITK
jgi:hypothetical protein